VSVGAGAEGGAGDNGWDRERGTLDQLWKGTSPDWTAARSERLFEGIMGKLEIRRRRRRFMRVALAFAGVAVTIMMGLRLVGFGIDGPLAHLWSHV
jgi:hypothetical protein